MNTTKAGRPPLAGKSMGELIHVRLSRAVAIGLKELADIRKQKPSAIAREAIEKMLADCGIVDAPSRPAKRKAKP